MKILHAADQHLGFRAYAKRVNGVNIREKDIYDTWGLLLQAVIQEKPDVFIIAGDLFNSGRPSAMSYIMAQLLRDVGCQVLVIAGTHDEKRSGDHSPVMTLNVLPNVRAVEYATMVMVGGKSFWLQPWVRTEDLVFEYADFYVAHLPLKGIPEYAYNKSYEIPNKKYEACFMGDLHRFLQTSGNIIYSGPLERFTFTEEGLEVGYVLWEDGEVTFKPLKVRDLVTLTDPVLDDFLLKQCTDKIVRVRMTKEIDLRELQEVALHVQSEPVRGGVTLSTGGKGTIGKTLMIQWNEFLATKKLEGEEVYKSEGEKYLKTALEKEE